MKTNQQGVLYFSDSVPLVALLEENGTIDGQVRGFLCLAPRPRECAALICASHMRCSLAGMGLPGQLWCLPHGLELGRELELTVHGHSTATGSHRQWCCPTAGIVALLLHRRLPAVLVSAQADFWEVLP
jgi:hypothetical protein